MCGRYVNTKKIDDIENDIANNISFEVIIEKNNLDFKVEKNYNLVAKKNNNQ